MPGWPMQNCDVCGGEYHRLELCFIGGGLNIEVCEECITSPKPKWISVEDRMPEGMLDVLVCMTVPDYDNFVTLGWYEISHKEWFVHREYVYGDFIPFITHWMPLPAPPKESD